MASSSRRAVEKITARVFCQLQGGGNPVTIFASTDHALSQPTQERLARTCDWESVVLGPQHRRSFYMPTGEEVSFCAHAAMGGSLVLAEQPETTVEFASNLIPDRFFESIVHADDIVSLAMNDCVFEEQQFGHDGGLSSSTLRRVLRDTCGLTARDLTLPRERSMYPTLVNSSIARPKTLVYVNSVEALHRARAPSIEQDQDGSTRFQRTCDALQTTGLYLYTQSNDDDDRALECRQFPRASGYPEDPATGIAAAALAVSLHQRGIRWPAYRCYQGTAMGQPSLIMVEDVKVDEQGRASFRLMGKVEIDVRETIQVDDDVVKA